MLNFSFLGHGQSWTLCLKQGMSQGWRGGSCRCLCDSLTCVQNKLICPAYLRHHDFWKLWSNVFSLERVTLVDYFLSSGAEVSQPESMMTVLKAVTKKTRVLTFCGRNCHLYQSFLYPTLLYFTSHLKWYFISWNRETGTCRDPLLPWTLLANCSPST